MAKGSGLAVLGLILAIGALGIGGYMIFTTQLGPHVHNTYYDASIPIYDPPSTLTWYDIPDISITFQVGAGETVYFFFTCAATVDPTSAVSLMDFRLEIDGVAATNSQITIGGTNIANDRKFSVSLQYADSLMTAGAHTVLVQTRKDCDGYVDHCSLLVQTYIP